MGEIPGENLEDRFLRHRLEWHEHSEKALRNCDTRVNWLSVDESEFRLTDTVSTRSALLRFIYEEQVSSFLSCGIEVMPLEDSGQFSDLLETTDELIDVSVNFIAGNYTQRNDKNTLWLDIPYVTGDGDHCVQQTYNQEPLFDRVHRFVRKVIR